MVKIDSSAVWLVLGIFLGGMVFYFLMTPVQTQKEYVPVLYNQGRKERIYITERPWYFANWFPFDFPTRPYPYPIHGPPGPPGPPSPPPPPVVEPPAVEPPVIEPPPPAVEPPPPAVEPAPSAPEAFADYGSYPFSH